MKWHLLVDRFLYVIDKSISAQKVEGLWNLTAGAYQLMNNFVKTHWIVTIVIEDPFTPENMDGATYPKFIANTDLQCIYQQETVVSLRSYK